MTSGWCISCWKDGILCRPSIIERFIWKSFLVVLFVSKSNIPIIKKRNVIQMKFLKKENASKIREVQNHIWLMRLRANCLLSTYLWLLIFLTKILSPYFSFSLSLPLPLALVFVVATNYHRFYFLWVYIIHPSHGYNEKGSLFPAPPPSLFLTSSKKKQKKNVKSAPLS